ncbi:MAG: tRNA glutamyl-Q(34) synthetase GluQRS [Myxococcota bacterium]
MPACKSAYRSRLAPSPTGRLHLGHARTALIAYLRALDQGGDLVLRIEDLDPLRSRVEFEAAIYEDLRWLGLSWAEGGDLGGAFGPYRQSERIDRYEEAFQRLVSMGAVYPCSCSRKDVAEAIANAPHGLAKTQAYPGTCRNGPKRSKGPMAYRFRMPERSPGFTDLFCGPIPEGKVPGDFVVRRADGLFSYQLAVVVDDAEMKITEVVRGEDLLDSTPRQIALYRALSLPVPRFLHVPLVLGGDGVKLSKRHGGATLQSLRQKGWSRARTLGWLADSLGLVPPPHIEGPSDLRPVFDLASVDAAPFHLPGTPELL